jgi:hypothetical protein
MNRKAPKKYLVEVDVIYSYECEISAFNLREARIRGCRLFHEKPGLVPSEQHPRFKATKIVLKEKEDI